MPRIRTFLALDLGEKIRTQLVNLQEALTPLMPEVKWVEPENLHLTLLFLGEISDRDLLPVCRATQKVAQTTGNLTFTVQGVGGFPNLRRPRVLWIGVERGREELITLHDALESPLLELGCYRREERLFTPHVTLGRLKSDPTEEALAAITGKYQAFRAGEASIKELLVMSSELMASGPNYTIMSRAKFSGRT